MMLEAGTPGYKVVEHHMKNEEHSHSAPTKPERCEKCGGNNPGPLYFACFCLPEATVDRRWTKEMTDFAWLLDKHARHWKPVSASVHREEIILADFVDYLSSSLSQAREEEHRKCVEAVEKAINGMAEGHVSDKYVAKKLALAALSAVKPKSSE